jgi:LuxR family maltose regulon positive regulatory protein
MDVTAEAACDLAEYMLHVSFGPGPQAALRLSRLVGFARPRPEVLKWLCFLFLHCYVGRWGMQEPIRDLVHALAAAADEAHPGSKLTSMLWAAWLAIACGDVSGARALREQVVEEARWFGEPSSVRVPLQYLTAIEKHLTGEDAAAQESLQLLASEAASNPGRRSAPSFLALSGLFAAAAGDWPAARAALASLEAAERPPWFYLDAMVATLRAELALHAHADIEARDLLRPELQHATDADHYGANAWLRMALARAESRLKDESAAWEVLEPILCEAKACGEVLGLLMSGPAALEELAAAHWPPAADPSLLALLRECAVQAVRLRAKAVEDAPPATGTALSERELQVLELVAAGRSNKLIARELGLSPHTVKRHLARIFDKTGQSSRGQLAAWHVHRSGRKSVRSAAATGGGSASNSSTASRS